MSGVQSLDEQQSANETIQADKTNINIIKQDIDDVQKIMLGTMDDIFRKGEGLAKLEEKAEQMASISNRYHQRSKELNRKRQYGCLALLILLALILFFLYKKFSN
ncbi:MAG: Vesicle-trafficking protein S22b [Marteilia pararefringens]